MPDKKTIARARRARHEGKRPTTQAGEFVREEIHHVRAGKHGARSTKQVIAIGLSKARRAGVKLGRPPAPSRTGSRALERDAGGAASPGALAGQARRAARRRGPAARRAAARKAAATKGPAVRKAAARKAAATRKAA